MSQSVRPDPVWFSLNQPATLLIWTRIERWDWTMLIFLFPLSLTSLHPFLSISVSSPSFWKMALKSSGTITSLQLSIFSSEIIWANFLKLTAWFCSFFRPAVILQELQHVAQWTCWKKISHWIFIWALNQKKRHYTDPYNNLWLPRLYALWDKKVSFIVRDLRDLDKSKLHA